MLPFVRNEGTVKKITGAPTLKIVHEPFKGKLADDDFDNFVHNLETAMENNGDVMNAVTRTTLEDLSPVRVLDLFKHISDEDCEILWVDPMIGRPENLVLQNL